ncbi:hypothetical protein MicloDRAFT_00034850 [Microvirga lotononidis]|uniref:Uncharacterized protein n=1 Tax=Microvirga lotononidis TaxID=864069 RepID=I4YSJ0_9HYPH|nr:hypothetical protein MicloDRAFT_00034850 [Microvirga lotononidis]
MAISGCIALWREGSLARTLTPTPTASCASIEPFLQQHHVAEPRAETLISNKVAPLQEAGSNPGKRVRRTPL